MAVTKWTARGAEADLASARIDWMWAAMGASSRMRPLPGVGGMRPDAPEPERGEVISPQAPEAIAPKEFQGLALARTKRKLAKMRSGRFS